MIIQFHDNGDTVLDLSYVVSIQFNINDIFKSIDIELSTGKSLILDYNGKSNCELILDKEVLIDKYSLFKGEIVNV